MKPLFVAFVVLSLAFTTRVHGQCGVPRYTALVAYAQSHGAGWELGWWPGDSRIGMFGGMAIESTKVSSPEKTSESRIMQTFLYLKLQARIIDRVALTTSLGLQDAQKGYYTAGLRFNYPLTEKLAAVAEPQMGSRGFNMLVGLAARLSN